MPAADPPEVLLQDMIASAVQAIAHVDGMTRDEFFASELHQDAVMRRLEIIGEAARSLPDDVRRNIDLPWRKIVAMRHVLAHDYDDLSVYVVWDVLSHHLAPLIEQCRAYLDGTPVDTPRRAGARFIVFDGNEGCGKSTQAKLLQQHLQERQIESILVRDPGTTRIGELIRAILLNPDHDEMGMRCEMLLYMAARAQMMKEVIQPALDAGKWVISDRFVSSTLAYQLGGDGLTADEITRTADIAIGGRWPDLTIILDLPVEISHARVQAKFTHKTTTLFGEEVTQDVKDRIEMRNREYHERVRANFLDQSKRHADRYRVVNANRTPQQIQLEVQKVIDSL